VVPISGIVTHLMPDLDAALCVWLLKRFGTERFPGIDSVPVSFFPAGRLPGGRTADALEAEEGILAVDTGQGRFDTHAPSGVLRDDPGRVCAADLVARELGVDSDPTLKRLLDFVRLQDLEGRSIATSDPMIHLVALPNIVRGLNLLYPREPERVIDRICDLFDAIHETEKAWVRALEDVKKARTIRVRRDALLMALRSSSGVAGRAARRMGSDLLIHQDGAGNIGITLRRHGPLKSIRFGPLAALLRVVEASLRKEKPDWARIDHVGTVQTWYLHDSGRILCQGSPKKPTRDPSRIPLDAILELTASRLDRRHEPPAIICERRRDPSFSCAACPIERLQMTSCKAFRLSTNNAPKNI